MGHVPRCSACGVPRRQVQRSGAATPGTGLGRSGCGPAPASLASRSAAAGSLPRNRQPWCAGRPRGESGLSFGVVKEVVKH